MGVTWKFIPQNVPHFGGLWEAAVNSVNFHLVRHLGNAFLNYKKLNTVLVRIEACPITPLSTDLCDFSVLTPGHFLIGGQITSPPEPDLSTITSNRLRRWQRATQFIQQIWSRWSREYLCHLQGRPEWNKSKGPPLEKSALVLIKENNLPPLKWKFGRVLDIYPCDDRIVRVALVKTENSEDKRAARLLCPLPMESN